MPTVIVFQSHQSPASSGKGEGKGGRDQLRVKESVADVIAKLETSNTGFADFALENNPKQTVWINKDHIRLVREV